MTRRRCSLDPETQIPSIGQIDAKLTAVLNLVEAVTRRFAEKAASIGPDTAKSAEGLSSAVKSVFDAISQVIAAVKDAGTCTWVQQGSTISRHFSPTCSIPLTNSPGEAKASTPSPLPLLACSVASRRLCRPAGLAPGNRGPASSRRGLPRSRAGDGFGGRRGGYARRGGGGADRRGTVVNNVTYNQQRTMNISVTNANADAARSNWSGLYGLSTVLTKRVAHEYTHRLDGGKKEGGVLPHTLNPVFTTPCHAKPSCKSQALPDRTEPSRHVLPEGPDALNREKARAQLTQTNDSGCAEPVVNAGRIKTIIHDEPDSSGPLLEDRRVRMTRV